MRPDPLLGRELAGFRIDTLLGRGGMSRVYRAWQLSLDRPVALKVLSEDLAENEDFRTRFLAESRAAATIEHPSILPVYDAGEADGHLYIAMRFVEGTDLRGLLEREGALAPERALRVLGRVASALDAAHAHGLVHRDVKPGNVLIAAGHAYLTDFGIAKIAGRKTLTRTNAFVGTVDYASPEQIRGDRIDAATDRYALGCVVFECLTGHLPYDRGTEYAVMQAHLNEPPPRVSALRAELSPAVDEVVSKALSKDREDRYRSCDDLIEALREALTAVARDPAALATLPPSAAGADWSPSQPVARTKANPIASARETARVLPAGSRRPLLFSLGAAGFVAIAAGLGFLGLVAGDGPDRTTLASPPPPTRSTPTPTRAPSPSPTLALIFATPTPTTSPTPTATPSPRTTPRRTAPPPRTPSPIPTPAPTPVNSTVTPASGSPGTTFQFVFSRLAAGASYSASIRPPGGPSSVVVTGQVPQDGTVRLSYLTGFDSPLGRWQYSLIAGSDGRSVFFDLR